MALAFLTIPVAHKQYMNGECATMSYEKLVYRIENVDKLSSMHEQSIDSTEVY